MTKKLLVDAGKKGMHVLDIGCGRGDLSLLLAGMVGAEGTVLGLVTFIHANLSSLAINHAQFDARLLDV